MPRVLCHSGGLRPFTTSGASKQLFGGERTSPIATRLALQRPPCSDRAMKLQRIHEMRWPKLLLDNCPFQTNRIFASYLSTIANTRLRIPDSSPSQGSLQPSFKAPHPGDEDVAAITPGISEDHLGLYRLVQE